MSNTNCFGYLITVDWENQFDFLKKLLYNIYRK